MVFGRPLYKNSDRQHERGSFSQINTPESKYATNRYPQYVA